MTKERGSVWLALPPEALLSIPETPPCNNGVQAAGEQTAAEHLGTADASGWDSC